jgi:hypothetical protein
VGGTTSNKKMARPAASTTGDERYAITLSTSNTTHSATTTCTNSSTYCDTSKDASPILQLHFY